MENYNELTLSEVFKQMYEQEESEFGYGEEGVLYEEIENEA